MCLSVEAIRSEIVNTIVEWYDKFVSVFFVAETPPDEIEVYKEPTLQLEGVEKVVEVKDSTMYSIKYINNGKTIVKYQQKLIENTPIKIDNEHGFTQKNITIGERNAMLFTYIDSTDALVWNDGKYSFTIFTYTNEIDIDTLILIAESIK